MLQYHISTTKHSSVPFFIRYVLYVLVVLFTQSLALMLQYHISTTKHSIVPVCIRYVLLCVCSILHTITCTNVTISHINNQKVYRSHAYTVYHFVFVVFCTQSLVLMLKYHISTIKHSTVPLFIRYVLLCGCCILHTITSTNFTISHINNQILISIPFVFHITSTCYITHISVCVCSLLYFTHNHLY